MSLVEESLRGKEKTCRSKEYQDIYRRYETLHRQVRIARILRGDRLLDNELPCTRNLFSVWQALEGYGQGPDLCRARVYLDKAEIDVAPLIVKYYRRIPIWQISRADKPLQELSLQHSVRHC